MDLTQMPYTLWTSGTSNSYTNALGGYGFLHDMSGRDGGRPCWAARRPQRDDESWRSANGSANDSESQVDWRKAVGYRRQVLDCGWSICWHRHVCSLSHGELWQGRRRGRVYHT